MLRKLLIRIQKKKNCLVYIAQTVLGKGAGDRVS
jgi:hypothetical protein